MRTQQLSDIVNDCQVAKIRRTLHYLAAYTKRISEDRRKRLGTSAECHALSSLRARKKVLGILSNWRLMVKYISPSQGGCCSNFCSCMRVLTWAVVFLLRYTLLR